MRIANNPTDPHSNMRVAISTIDHSIVRKTKLQMKFPTHLLQGVQNLVLVSPKTSTIFQLLSLNPRVQELNCPFPFPKNHLITPSSNTPNSDNKEVGVLTKNLSLNPLQHVDEPKRNQEITLSCSQTSLE